MSFKRGTKYSNIEKFLGHWWFPSNLPNIEWRKGSASFWPHFLWPINKKAVSVPIKSWERHTNSSGPIPWMGWGDGPVDWVFTLGTASAAATFANSLIAAVPQHCQCQKMAKWRDYAVFWWIRGGRRGWERKQKGPKGGEEEKAVQKRENTTGRVVGLGQKALNVR